MSLSSRNWMGVTLFVAWTPVFKSLNACSTYYHCWSIPHLGYINRPQFEVSRGNLPIGFSQTCRLCLVNGWRAGLGSGLRIRYWWWEPSNSIEAAFKLNQRIWIWRTLVSFQWYWKYTAARSSLQHWALKLESRSCKFLLKYIQIAIHSAILSSRVPSVRFSTLFRTSTTGPQWTNSRRKRSQETTENCHAASENWLAAT